MQINYCYKNESSYTLYVDETVVRLIMEALMAEIKILVADDNLKDALGLIEQWEHLNEMLEEEDEKE